MALFKFLKKIINKDKRSKVVKEKISLDNISSWIKKKENNLSKEAELVYESLSESINKMNKELEVKLPILKSIDVESFGSDQRSKSIVKGNLKAYINYVERLAKNINNLKFTTIEEYGFNLENYFIDFLNKTKENYQKASFMINKELIDVKDALAKFYGKQKRVYEDNKKIIDLTNTLNSIKAKLDSIVETERNSKEEKQKITSLKKNIESLSLKKKSLLEKIEKIKSSKEYISNLKKKEEVKSEKEKLKKDYRSLKHSIDFKALANEYHGSEKHMNLIKAYKDDFVPTLHAKDGSDLVKLLKEGSLLTDSLKDKIIDLKNKKENLLKKESSIKESNISAVQEEINKVENDIKTIEIEIKETTSISEKLKNSKNSIIEEIRDDLAEIDVELE